MGVAVIVGLLGAAGVLIVSASLSVLAARLAGVPVRWRATLLTLLVGMVVAAAVWISGLTGIPAPFGAPVIALGGLFAIVATLHQRETSAPLTPSLTFAALLTALVFAPLVTLVFALWYDPLATGLGYLDLGAALPTEVAAGAAVSAVALLGRRAPTPPLRPERSSSLQPWSLVWPALVLFVGWIGWLVGLELAFDGSTAVILTNTVIMPPAAALAYAVVERARHRTNTVIGAISGFLAGCAAATPSAGYLLPQLAVLTALIVGALCALLPRRRSATSIAGTLAVGAAVSLVLLGLLAKDISFIYTGQPEVIFGQVLTVLIGGAAGFLIALALWALLRPRSRA